MNGTTAEKEFVIHNKLGLHARAATRFVQTAARFKSDVDVVKDGQIVNGKSIMGMLMLVAAKGTRLIIRAKGEDAEETLAALGDLILMGFGEFR